MMELTGVTWATRDMATGHSPFLSRPQELMECLVGMVEEVSCGDPWHSDSVLDEKSTLGASQSHSRLEGVRSLRLGVMRGCNFLVRRVCAWFEDIQRFMGPEVPSDR